MPAGSFHNGIVGGKIVRVSLGQDLPGGVQILPVVGVDILAVVCFDPVMPLFRQNHIRFQEETLDFFLGQDAFFFAANVPPREISPVMAQADVIRIQMIDTPIEPSQLTEGFILFTDVPPGIIVGIGQSRADGAANLHRQIHPHIRHGIRLVGGNNDGDVLQLFLLFGNRHGVM